MRRVAAFAGVALVLPGCLFSDDATTDAAALTAARARWSAAGIEAYTVQETVLCFCTCPPRFTAEVAGGAVTGVSEVVPMPGQTDEQAAAAALTCARTVTQVFDLLATWVDRADSFQVEYDPGLGYPTDVRIDPERQAADEEIHLELSALAPQ